MKNALLGAVLGLALVVGFFGIVGISGGRGTTAAYVSQAGNVGGR